MGVLASRAGARTPFSDTRVVGRRFSELPSKFLPFSGPFQNANILLRNLLIHSLFLMEAPARVSPSDPEKDAGTPGGRGRSPSSRCSPGGGRGVRVGQAGARGPVGPGTRDGSEGRGRSGSLGQPGPPRPPLLSADATAQGPARRGASSVRAAAVTVSVAPEGAEGREAAAEP